MAEDKREEAEQKLTATRDRYLDAEARVAAGEAHIAELHGVIKGKDEEVAHLRGEVAERERRIESLEVSWMRAAAGGRCDKCAWAVTTAVMAAAVADALESSEGRCFVGNVQYCPGFSSQGAEDLAIARAQMKQLMEQAHALREQLEGKERRIRALLALGQEKDRRLAEYEGAMRRRASGRADGLQLAGPPWPHLLCMRVRPYASGSD